jgi:mono/diheme cytochrome c family protein
MATSRRSSFAFDLALTCLACACGSPEVVTYEIVPAQGQSLAVTLGDSVSLSVVAKLSDGTSRALASDAVVTWPGVSVVVAAPPSGGGGVFPASGPSATRVYNPVRPEESLDGVFFITGAASAPSDLVIHAAILEGDVAAEVTTTLHVSPTPAGDATAGDATYQSSCARCHGATGHGSPKNADGTYTIDNQHYAFPAPGLNAEPGNVAADADWSAALLAVCARADIDNAGVGLRQPMPEWQLSTLTTQDFANVYAFLKTQTH